MKIFALAIALSVLIGCTSRRTMLDATSVPPSDISVTALDGIDAAVRTAILQGDIPGAAVEVIHHGSVVYRKAFGARALYPRYEPNSIDTVYDLASITKPVATATAVMKLVEQGKIRLWDRAAHYDPAFAAHGKELVTVEELLDHSAGLRSALDEGESVAPLLQGERIVDAMPLHFAPGSRYEYCNTCFIELARIVRIISKRSLEDFTASEIFEPLGISREMFFHAPSGAAVPLSPEAAVQHDTYVRGRFVIAGHGPIGASGHAGLFASADALAAYAQMLLNHGSYNGIQILSPLTVETMIAPHYLGRSTQRIGNVRGLGWDEATTDSSSRGELFGMGGFGHTGSTGCSLWIDPATETAVIFLSNAAHVKRDNDDDIVRLYARISTLAAAAVVDADTQQRVAEQAASWSAQVAAQAPGFERWTIEDERLWNRTHEGTRY